MCPLSNGREFFSRPDPKDDQKELSMKASMLSAIVFIASLFLYVIVFASDSHKKTLHIFDTVSVEGKTLAPGDYKVEWSCAGTTVQLTILQGRDRVATVPAQEVASSNKNDKDGYTLKPGENGSQQLANIFFTGENFTLELEPGSPSAQRNPSGTL